MVEFIIAMLIAVFFSALAISLDAALWVVSGIMLVGVIVALVIVLAMRAHRNPYHVF